jgi:hypothetical protein
MCVCRRGGYVSILINKTIRLFLDSIGRRDEYEYYLERFRSDHSRAFALVCPVGDGFAEVASVFSFDLSFLLRLELDPVILLCGPDAIKMRNILFAGEHPFSAHLIDISGAHIKDHTADILSHLAECRKRSKIMVLVDPSTSAEEALQHIVPAVSNRIHFVRTRGPLHDKNGNRLYYYYTRNRERPVLAESDRAIAETAGYLLNQSPRTHISVASPLQLLQELFTVKGAGCVIRSGSEIHHFSNHHLVDNDRLTALLEGSFRKKLVSRDFLERITDLYIEENYNGAALLEPHGDSMYLSKFTVEKAARGEGLAVELWRRVVSQHGSVFWRSGRNNPVNHWYEKLSDGCHCTDIWKIFWRGIPIENIPEIIEFALQQTEDFEHEPV